MDLQTIDDLIMKSLVPERWTKVIADRYMPPVWWAEVLGKENHRWEPRAHHHLAVCSDHPELAMSWGVDLADRGESSQPEWVKLMTFRKPAGATCVDVSWSGSLVLRVRLWKYDGAYLADPQEAHIPEDPEDPIDWQISADQLDLAKLITALSGPTDFEPGKWLSRFAVIPRTGLRWTQ